MKDVNVPEGYKSTDVGVIPEDWNVKELGVILKVKHGKTQHHIVDENGKYPILATGGEIGKTNTFLSDKPSVLIGRKGTIDVPQYTEKPFWTIDTLFYTEISNRGFPKFIFYWFHLINWYSYNEASGVPSLNSNTIKNIKITLPPLPEQKTIARVLSDVDELIRECDSLIVKKRDIKQGTMQQLLTGKKRLPGFSGEWEVKKLGDVLKVKHGKTQHHIVDENGKYPILATGGEIGKTNTFLYNKPSVLIGRKGTIDVPQYTESPFWTIDTLFYTEVYNKAIPKFIFYKFNLINWYSYNEASGVPSLNAYTIENIDSCFPPTLSEQKTIARVLSDMDAEIEALEKKRALLNGGMKW